MAWSCPLSPSPTSWWSTMQKAEQSTMLMGNYIDFAPLIITGEEIERGMEIFEDAIKGMPI